MVVLLTQSRWGVRSGATGLVLPLARDHVQERHFRMGASRLG